MRFISTYMHIKSYSRVHLVTVYILCAFCGLIQIVTSINQTGG